MSSVQIRTSPFVTFLEPLTGSFGQNVIRRTASIFGSRILYRFCQNGPVSGSQEVATGCSYYTDDIFDFCQSRQRTQNFISGKEKDISMLLSKSSNFIYIENLFSFPIILIIQNERNKYKNCTALFIYSTLFNASTGSILFSVLFVIRFTINAKLIDKIDAYK